MEWETLEKQMGGPGLWFIGGGPQTLARDMLKLSNALRILSVSKSVIKSVRRFHQN
ncbi:hypothetical protein KIN20_027358 [Parelaphostrongylus tenuis]|uniref:Uncharacterized protein n=1 Tax=Parelaphostrongylus tenuis TaxID=148309 RepID=A0AAD5WE16_PARTN|nr:hypothetical protein KIN20_027358 [Parelaphostrongylus tenuis]